MLKLVIGGFCAVSVLIVYSCCRVAGRADEWARQLLLDEGLPPDQIDTERGEARLFVYR